MARAVQHCSHVQYVQYMYEYSTVDSTVVQREYEYCTRTRIRLSGRTAREYAYLAPNCWSVSSCHRLLVLRDNTAFASYAL